MKQCAVPLAEVVSLEDRDGTTFVGVDAGWNVINEQFLYRVPLLPDPVPGGRRRARGASVTVAGHINEGNDLFAEDHPLPAVEEGDIVGDPTSAPTTRR